MLIQQEYNNWMILVIFFFITVFLKIYLPLNDLIEVLFESMI